MSHNYVSCDLKFHNCYKKQARANIFLTFSKQGLLIGQIHLQDLMTRNTQVWNSMEQTDWIKESIKETIQKMNGNHTGIKLMTFKFRVIH